MASARQILHQASTPEELIGKLLEAADMLEGNHEASPQHATAYFAMASGLREAARALSLLPNKPSEPPARHAGRVRPPSAIPADGIDARADSTAL